MKKTSMTHFRTAALAATLTSCSSLGGFPQTPDQFVALYSKGGMFNKAEEVVLSQPYATVLANIRDFSEKCVNRHRVASKRDYATRQTASVSDFRSTVSTADGTTTFSIQEEYNEQQVKNLPKGGMYVLVAKVRKGGTGTVIGLYHLNRGNMALGFKEWARGDKKTCPALGK